MKSNTITIIRHFLAVVAAALCFACLFAESASSAGILTPRDSDCQPIQILDHCVDVTINNGFAVTEVFQTFFNPNDRDLEAVYSFPVPKSASLSEVTIYAGEEELNGEVLAKERARRIYEEERSSGKDSGLAEKNEFYTFEFSVYPVRAQGETRIRFLYYQPLEIELGIGRYVYPLEDGGTDEAVMDFWTGNSRVERFFSANIELKSAWPVTMARIPGFESATAAEKKGDGHYVFKLEKQSTELNRDLVFYYRLQDDLPGRVELIPYRADTSGPGTFMMVVTPGMDLQPLENGADYTFVLDVSGSMSSKIRTLARGVVKALGEMNDRDRFRIIAFNSTASELTGGWVTATSENVLHYSHMVESMQASGSTNLFAGLRLALESLDDDRATSIVLVTDAVTNTGIVSPEAFHKLMKQYDVRVFGFLMGNSANWPLMRIVCEASGGFSAGVSNDDDIIGQIMLAKGKVLYECLHDAELTISGVRIHEALDGPIGKVYRGQQLVIMGRYDEGGRATVTLKGRTTGEDRVYTTEFDFPEVDGDHPEIERLWALNRIERLEHMADIGMLPAGESQEAVRDLGVKYQLVTDETSMVILTDSAYEQRGLERKNAARTALEREARSRRAQEVSQTGRPARDQRVDRANPMFSRPAPSSNGGGAFDPMTVGIVLGFAWLGRRAVKRSQRKGRS